MKQTVTKNMFVDEFKSWDTYKDNFSYEGLEALYDYFESIEDPENEMELDVVAICCDFSEYESIDEFNKDYYGENNKDDYKTLEELQDETTVIEVEDDNDSRIIVQSF